MLGKNVRLLGKRLGKNVRHVRKVVRLNVRKKVGSAPAAWLPEKSSKNAKKRRVVTRRPAKGEKMEEKIEISWGDIRDRIVKDRCAIGFLSENVADYELRGVLLLIEESMMVSEQMIKYLLDQNSSGTVAEHQTVAESVPFD